LAGRKVRHPVALLMDNRAPFRYDPWAIH
jgi:hypothetical protein